MTTTEIFEAMGPDQWRPSDFCYGCGGEDRGAGSAAHLYCGFAGTGPAEARLGTDRVETFGTAAIFAWDLVPALRLRAQSAAVARLEGDMRSTVRELRAAGASWDAIGSVLGVTRQAATQRYGRFCR